MNKLVGGSFILAFATLLSAAPQSTPNENQPAPATRQKPKNGGKHHGKHRSHKNGDQTKQNDSGKTK